MLEKRILDKLLSRIEVGAIGIRFWDGESRTYGNGSPEAVVRINDRNVVWRVLQNYSLGYGEAYMDQRLEIDGSLVAVFKLMAQNRRVFGELPIMKSFAPRAGNDKQSQGKHISHHYDIGNDFFRLWLDESLSYSCAYFTNPNDSLETAQKQKRAYLLRKLQLQKGHRLLDIGSGWGSLLIEAAQKYDVEGLGITLSKEQLSYSQEVAAASGVADKVKFELANFQDLPKRGMLFDRIISVGMFEHVGRSNQDLYFEAVADMLVSGGVSVLHTITSSSELPNDAWVDKYIFPGGYLPSVRQVTSALPGHGFSIIDFESLRLHYAMTCHEWWKRFEDQKKTVIKMYDERFYRMWRLWLACCVGEFLYGDIDLGQFVFSKGLKNDLPLTREFLYQNQLLQKQPKIELTDPV